MIYAFTEVEKEQIESSGMMVVEFKRNLRMIESMGKAVSHAWNGLMKLAEVVGRICCEVCKKLIGMVDDIRLAFEEIQEDYDYPTSRGYKVVKILSKCTGLEKREVWKMTRYTRLARSCC